MSPRRCPVCKADIVEGSQCRRCRADLSLLVSLRTQRQNLLKRAEHQLALGRWRDAAALARQADGLQSDEQSQRLCAMASVMAHDFVAAWNCYCRWRQTDRREVGN